jgi:hypothetical protein
MATTDAALECDAAHRGLGGNASTFATPWRAREMKFIRFSVTFWAALAGQSVLCYAGPYAPAADQAGSTAIGKSDPGIIGWATGYQDYTLGTNVDAVWQTPEKALGPAVGDSFDIVSLGRGGAITLVFGNPITDGAGFDFAVFENGIADTFLELGYVEASSNGTDFFRFANDSLSPNPVGAFGTLDPTNVDGLAGKYRQGFGTPFDLAELAGVSPLLDVANVAYVRIVDIVGDGTYLDSSGDPIYDPYPTIGSAGFDLEAVAVLHAVPEPLGWQPALVAVLAMLGAAWRYRRLSIHLINRSTLR